MLKTYHFPIPEVAQFSGIMHNFLPQHPDSTTVRHETESLQLMETYLDYHSVFLYRIEAYVEADCILPLKTSQADFHLLYAVKSPSQLIIQNSKIKDHIQLPGGHGTYAYVPKGKFTIHLQYGHYLVYGLLIDVGFIRANIFPSHSFLYEFKTARLRDKKKLYQTPVWPIKEKTSYQIQRLEEIFFHYHPDHEAEIIKMLYILFGIAKFKQFKTYEWIDPNEDLAKRVRSAIQDLVSQEFSNLSLSGLSAKFDIGHKRLIAVHKQYFNQTLQQYLHQLIIIKAKEKLILYTVNETATYCGYSEVSSFSDFFLKEVGLRPSAYQQQIINKKN
nr:helix-turn-helix domain-containing protein [uncultured Sphingobacterium sp.]